MSDRLRSLMRAAAAATSGRAVGTVYEGTSEEWTTRVRYLGCGPPGSTAGCACIGSCFRVEQVEFALRDPADFDRAARVQSLTRVLEREGLPSTAIVMFPEGADPAPIHAAIAGVPPNPPRTRIVWP